MSEYEFEAPRQKRLHQRLELIGPGAAAFYRDACRLMALDPPLAATTHLVGHLLREIESSLRYVLEPLQSSEEPRPKEKTPKGKSGPKKEGGHAQEVRAVLTTLKIDVADPVAVAWLRLTSKSEKGLHSWAHRDALSAPRPVDDDFRRLWDEVQGILDAVLDRFEANYARTMAEIDRLIEIESPQEADITRFRNYIPQTPVALGYFFDRLRHPTWLRPLVDAGYFSSAPAPEEVEPGQIAFPRWSPGEFLCRVGANEQVRETVIHVLDTIEPTKNVRVNRVLLDVLLLLPPQDTVPFVDRAIEWLDVWPSWFTPERLAKLMVRLAEGGQPQAALRVARALFRVEPGVRRDGGASVLPPEPTGRYESARYEHLLRDHVAALTAACGIATLEVLCGLLDQALSLHSEPPRSNFPEDYSEIWRSAVEGHAQNVDRSVTSSLVSAVRDAACQLRDWSAAVSMLETLGWKIARRVALHVLREHLPETLPAARARVLDRRNFDDSDLWHEYWLLSEACLPLLEEHDCSTFFQWIDAGPDLARYAGIVTALHERPPTDDEVREHVSRWTSKRLAAVRRALNEGRARQLAALSEVTGPPEHPQFDRYTTTWIGPTAHMTREELAALGDDQLVTLLQTWEPSGRDMADSRDGLGRRITELAAADPVRLSRLAPGFRDLDPTYVRALLDGLWQVVRPAETEPAISISIDWEAVLTLAAWVCAQPSVPISRTGFGQGDLHWSWTRRSLASLISRGLSDGPIQIPLALREPVWSVLVVLLEDPDPTAADEVEFGANSLEYARRTTRGHALHSLIKFASWIGRHDPAHLAAREASQLLAELPDVRRLLERHVRPDMEPSAAVHSVYGSRLLELLSMDRGWTAAHVPAIFCEVPAPLGDAAWRGFVDEHRAHRVFLELLHAQYERALAIEEPVTDHPSEYERDLSTHIIELYATEAIELGDGSLLGRLFARSSPARRRSILHSIGFRLGQTPSPLDARLAERFQALWDWWRDSVLRTGTAPPRELAAFGWWFSSGRLGDEWSLRELEGLLTRGVPVEPDFKVVEQLGELVGPLPRLVLRCLCLLPDVWPREWMEMAGRDECEAIFQSLLCNGDRAVAAGAEALINRLVARGHVELRALLSAPGRGRNDL